MTDYRGWPATNGPAAVNAGAQATRGLEFYVTSSAWLTALHLYKGGTNGTGTVRGRLYTVNSGGTSGTAVTGTDVTFTGFGNGWNTATLPNAVALSPNQRYRAAILSQTWESETQGYFTTGAGSAGITNGPLVIPNRANSTGTRQGSYNIATTLGFPGSDPIGAYYWVDVTVTDVDPTVLTRTQFFPFMGA